MLSAELEKKLVGRVQEGLTDLIDSETIRQLVIESVKTTFFTKPVATINYGSVQTVPDTTVVNLIREALKPAVEDAVRKHFETNRGAINLLIDGIVREGITDVVSNVINSKFQDLLFSFGQQLMSRIGRSM